MLARLFCPTPRSGFDAALDAFHQAYANISTAFALCDGLEIIATNESFAALFNLDVERRRTTFLTRMLHDKNDLERLFAYPAVPVEFDKPERVALTVHSWALDPQFWLLHAEDQSELEDLRGQLSQTRNHDASTGTLLPGAFNAVLQRQLPQLANNDEYGLLCQIYLVPFNHQNPNLNREETSELITDLVEKLHWEFGTECPACCNETLALTIFLPFGSAHGEDQHVLNQMRRIAIQTVKAHRSQLLVHIGAAAFPEDGRTVSQLLVAADLARRSITERDGEKGGTAIRSSPDIVQARLRNTQLALDMAAAIDNGEITPHFQPVIEPATGNIQSFEALIRWHHPELGRVAPPDIIAIACGANLLDVLTEQTLRHTARQAKNWPAPVKFAINVTPSQLNSNLVDLVRRTTREMSLDPARLEIEVTEDALIHDFKTSASIFARLRAIGVSIAMDDFGNVVNPLIVTGQVQGGLAQGIGQALLEHGIYDENGQLLSGSLMDYAMPRADDLPNFVVDHSHATRCTHNPIGVKGCGEAGAIGSPPTVVNAVVDALQRGGHDVEHIDMPVSPARVWAAMNG